MDDSVRNLAIALFAMLGLHGALQERINRAAKQQLTEAFAGRGRMDVSVAPHGVFGVEANDLYEVDVTGVGIMSDRLPLYVFSRRGWKGHIRHLRLHFSDVTLRGLHVKDYRADIPSVSYDLGHALYRGRLVLRGTGAGPAAVTVTAEDLREFVLKKYTPRLSEINVDFKDSEIAIQGTERIFGKASFRTIGGLIPREGRYLDLDPNETVLQLNGSVVNDVTKIGILKLVNPVLDIESDLGLRGYFSIEWIEIRSDDLVIHGRARVPDAPTGTDSP